MNIITDQDKKKKEDMYLQLLAQIEEEEEITWGAQFIKAIKLHPVKNEEGEIEDVEAMDAFVHFVSIGWKVLFALVPPAHYYGGVPCFFIALAFTGGVTMLIEKAAILFGCVLGIKATVTAVTFVSLGTSLPDTFASMIAATSEDYADAAIGNVTGSNSVNVFLGLGLPWVIAAIYESNNKEGNGKYYVPAGSLGFSVVVFVCVAIACIVTLVVRRCVVGGELGGSETGRKATAAFFVFLWLIYVVLVILQAYNIGGLGDVTFGVDVNVENKCNPKRRSLLNK